MGGFRVIGSKTPLTLQRTTLFPLGHNSAFSHGDYTIDSKQHSYEIQKQEKLQRQKTGGTYAQLYTTE